MYLIRLSVLVFAVLASLRGDSLTLVSVTSIGEPLNSGAITYSNALSVAWLLPAETTYQGVTVRAAVHSADPDLPATGFAMLSNYLGAPPAYTPFLTSAQFVAPTSGGMVTMFTGMTLSNPTASVMSFYLTLASGDAENPSNPDIYWLADNTGGIVTTAPGVDYGGELWYQGPDSESIDTSELHLKSFAVSNPTQGLNFDVTVPEPSSTILLLSGGLAVLLLLRRRAE